MKTLDALNILGIKKTLELTEKEVKKAFHAACMKYHPDRNPAGNEMMKMAIQAWEALQKKGFSMNWEGINEAEIYDYGKEVNAALSKTVGLYGIEIEVCGSWVWVGGTSYHQRGIFCPQRKFDPETKQAIPEQGNPFPMVSG